MIKAAVLVLAGMIAAGWPTGHDMVEAAPRTETATYPWTGTDDEIVVDLAIGSLRDSMMQWLTSERGVHAETLLVSIGAVAGFAAQTAALHRARKRDVPLPAGFDKSASEDAFYTQMREAGLILVARKDAQNFYFGDLINGYLVQQSTTLNHSLFAILSAAAIESGVKPADLPDMRALFRHVSSTIAKGEGFGVLHPPPPLSPQLTPREALDKFWPRVKFIFERTDGQGIVEPAKGRNVKPEYWPMISALVARQLLLMAKDVIEPRIALSLIMESAIEMSKVDPETVPKTEKEGTK